MSLAYEIQYGQALLPLMKPESAAELLQKDRQALCRSEEQDRIDFRDIDALVVQVDDKENVQLTVPKRSWADNRSDCLVSAEGPGRGLPPVQIWPPCRRHVPRLHRNQGSRALCGSSKIAETLSITKVARTSLPV